MLVNSLFGLKGNNIIIFNVIYHFNAASRYYETSYNKFINALKNQKIILNKKILSEIILKDENTFKKLVN